MKKNDIAANKTRKSHHCCSSVPQIFLAYRGTQQPVENGHCSELKVTCLRKTASEALLVLVHHYKLQHTARAVQNAGHSKGAGRLNVSNLLIGVEKRG